MNGALRNQEGCRSHCGNACSLNTKWSLWFTSGVGGVLGFACLQLNIRIIPSKNIHNGS